MGASPVRGESCFWTWLDGHALSVHFEDVIEDVGDSRRQFLMINGVGFWRVPPSPFPFPERQYLDLKLI